MGTSEPGAVAPQGEVKLGVGCGARLVQFHISGAEPRETTSVVQASLGSCYLCSPLLEVLHLPALISQSPWDTEALWGVLALARVPTEAMGFQSPQATLRGSWERLHSHISVPDRGNAFAQPVASAVTDSVLTGEPLAEASTIMQGGPHTALSQGPLPPGPLAGFSMRAVTLTKPHPLNTFF